MKHFTTLAAAGLVAAATVAFAPLEAKALGKYEITKPAGYADYTVTVTGPPSGNFQAGPFQLTNDTDKEDTFIAWCFDLIGTVTFGQKYDYSVGSFLDSSQLARVQSVFDANYTLVSANLTTNALYGQAFQVALWDAIYDNDFSIEGGNFRATGPNPSDIIAKAEKFLAAAKTNFNDDDASPLWIITQLDGGVGVQNLGTAVIPLPAAAWLLLAASGGLIAAKRRSARRAA